MTLSLRPMGSMLVGEIVDVVKRGVIDLSDARTGGLTTFVRVESVGPDVTRCKAGDLIMPRAVNHCILRDGWKRVLVVDEDVWAIVEGMDIKATTESPERERA